MLEGEGLSLSKLIGDFVSGLVGKDKGRESNVGEGTLEDEPNCVLATDEDFSGTANGEFMYIGSADCVKIPHVIKGVEVTSYVAMFAYTNVKKVLSDNP